MNRCSGLVKEIKIFLYRLSFHNIMILGKCNEWMRRKGKKYSDISHSVLDFNAYIIIPSKYMASIEIGRGWPYFFVRQTFNAETHHSMNVSCCCYCEYIQISSFISNPLPILTYWLLFPYYVFFQYSKLMIDFLFPLFKRILLISIFNQIWYWLRKYFDVNQIYRLIFILLTL